MMDAAAANPVKPAECDYYDTMCRTVGPVVEVGYYLPDETWILLESYDTFGAAMGAVRDLSCVHVRAQKVAPGAH
jgi:hypothetical protein